MATATSNKVDLLVTLELNQQETQLLVALLGNCNGATCSRSIYCALLRELENSVIKPANLNGLPMINLHEYKPTYDNA